MIEEIEFTSLGTDSDFMTTDRAKDHYAKINKYSIYADRPSDANGEKDSINIKKDTKVNVKISREMLKAERNTLLNNEYTQKVALMTIVSKYPHIIFG